MTYSISISGHLDDLDSEAAVVDAARATVRALPGVSYAIISTTNGGSVDLLRDDEPTVDPSTPEPDAEPAAVVADEGDDLGAAGTEPRVDGDPAATTDVT